MRYSILCIISLCVLLVKCRGANIAVYIPLPFYSHQVAFKPLWLELAKRGHNITLIQSDVIIENNENITHVVLGETYDIMSRHKFFETIGKGVSVAEIMATTVHCFAEVLEYHFTHHGVQELVKTNTVDLLFVELLATFGLNLASRINAPTIGLVSMDAGITGHSFMGNPTHPVMYPERDLAVSPVITFKQKISSVLYWLSFIIAEQLFMAPMQERVAQKCLGEPALSDNARNNVSMLFINANPLFNADRPLGFRTVNIGAGIHLLKPTPLPKDLQEYLDRSKHGVIYFSLGSSITGRQISQSTKSAIVETFSQLPYDILWKLDEIPNGLPENVKIMKWLPQQDVLRHKNIKLFITQGGLQSMEEAIFSYVPMVALPFYGDQPNNANKMVSKGFGLMLDHTRLDVKTFKEAILEVINNSSYKTRTKELADLVMDQPMTGLEKAVWWTEYVLRHGHTDHFRNPSIDIPLYQYLLLDVISFILLVTLVTIYAFIKILQVLKWVLSKLFRKISGAAKVKVH